MSTLWQGTTMTRMRVASGLVLFTYAVFHFLNLGLGLFSPEWMEAGQTWRQWITRSLLGEILLYWALLTHAGIALIQLARRSTLRMPLWELTQMVLGLTIPVFLIVHIVFTRVAFEQLGVNDDYAFIIGLIAGSPSGWQQNTLLLVVWIHGCIGMHFWLRGQAWWRRSQPWLISLANLIPGFALAGYLVESRRMQALMQDGEARAAMFEQTNWPDGEGFAYLISTTDRLELLFYILLGLAAAIYLLRKFLIRRSSVRISYVDGPEITAPKGMTLLEMSRANGVAHTSLCGGRGRCSTCRVMVESGGDHLPPPDDVETRVLDAVSAPPGARLACQLRPEDAMTVYRMFREDGRRKRSHANQSDEQRMAILFLDIRGFTARTTGQLPYDVVFLLNRFFDAIVPAILRAGGSVDKYLGDGLLAIFDTGSPETSAHAALRAVTEIGGGLEQFNKGLIAEGTPAVRIGIGLHLGDLVLGEIGAAGHAPRTIIGETVNAASRLEAKTKELGVELLVSDTVLETAGIETKYLKLETLTLRGVPAPVRALAVKSSLNLPGLLPKLLD